MSHRLTEPQPSYSTAGPRVLLDTRSPEFAWRTIGWFKAIHNRTSRDERDLAAALDELREYRVAEVYPPEQPYGDLDTLLQVEIGKSLAELEGQIASTERERTRLAAEQTTGDIQTHGGDRKSESGSRAKLVIDSRVNRAMKNGIGRETQKHLDALAKSHPALFAEVKAGRLSVHAAAVQAGIVKPTTTVRTDDLDAVARFLVKHFTCDQIAEITSRAKAMKAER